MLFLDREESKDGALVEPRCNDQFYRRCGRARVSVRTGVVVWRGNAHYPQCVDLSRRTFPGPSPARPSPRVGLARPSGQLEIPSSLMCTAGQN